MNSTRQTASVTQRRQRIPFRPAGTFGRLARATARATGHPWAFGLALGIILVWVVTGPLFHFSDTWQLVINTATTIVTFLMVFLIQSTQNRDSEAVQLKLDELLRATEAAHNALLDLEELSECELDQIKERYLRLARQAREDLGAGRNDVGSPEVRPAAHLGATEQSHGTQRRQNEAGGPGVASVPSRTSPRPKS